MIYRSLTTQEITLLMQRACIASNWQRITVHKDFLPESLYNVHFSGDIQIGCMNNIHILPGGIECPSGIRNTKLHNVSIGDNCYIDQIPNGISNYTIGNNVRIISTNKLIVDKSTSFGNGQTVAVLDETGGREITIHNALSAQLAYIQTLYRHRPILTKQLSILSEQYAQQHNSSKGSIGDHVHLISCGSLCNVNIGSHAHLEGVARLTNCSINSNADDPIHIGHGVIADDCILSSGCHIDEGSMLTRCFVGQACHLRQSYSAVDSLFFANCHGGNGEACAIFAGPYTVTHHKATLLIAGMFSFMNAGSGSNQSNHMYKLGPVHQGIMERGAKAASDSYVLWPARIGAFSLVMGRHVNHPDTTDFPFSYLIEYKQQTLLVPGINLKTVGTMRDAAKWPKRDKRKDKYLLDQINFDLLSPYTIQKIWNGRQRLQQLIVAEGASCEVYSINNTQIHNSALKKGIQYYELALNQFLGHALIDRLKHQDLTSAEKIHATLHPQTNVGQGEWVDIAGLIAPKSELKFLLQQIEEGTIKQIEDINAAFAEIHKQYHTLCWRWAYDKLEEYYQISLSTVTSEQLIHIVRQWESAELQIKQMVCEDAKKEFSQESMTGFGADGLELDKRLDFEQVRGHFEDNEFVQNIIKQMQEVQVVAEQLIHILKKSTNELSTTKNDKESLL